MIIGLNLSHNGSICVLDDEGNIDLYIEEERISRKKRDTGCIKSLDYLLRLYGNKIDLACIVDSYNNFDKLSSILRKRIFNQIKARLDLEKIPIFDYRKDHHLCHASNGFFASGFDDAVVMVLDGAGSYVEEYGAIESESYFYFKHGQEPVLIKRVMQGDRGCSDSKNIVVPHQSVGYAFSYCSLSCGFGFHDAGKVMGLAPYGKQNRELPSALNKDCYISNQFIEYCKKTKSNYEENICKDLSYCLQKDSLELAKNRISKCIDFNLSKNIVISGGYSLNCVNNYLYLNCIQSKNLYVDPLGHDGGTSVGAAKLKYYIDSSYRKQPQKLNSLFLGPMPNYVKIDNAEKLTMGDVCDCLLQKKTVALYGGRSEAGPRALGNRSILFDAVHSDAKDIVNKIKKREQFRPFGCSVLLDRSSDIFDMKDMQSSNFMSYAISCKESERFPGTSHKDNTSRLQTIENNHVLYDILSHFYQATGRPLLMHTSLNLAGDPLVETVDEALETFYKSDLDVIYFYDLGIGLVK